MNFNVAIVGATGLVSSKFIQALEEIKFPINKIYFFASEGSAGKKLVFLGKE